MKKLLTFLLCVCTIGAIGISTACTPAEPSESSSSIETVEDKVKSKARSYVTVKCYATYGYIPSITTFLSKSYTDENTYYVSGKYTVRDNYGDSYTGKYDLTVVYDPETDTCSVSQNNLQTPYLN